MDLNNCPYCGHQVAVQREGICPKCGGSYSSSAILDRREAKREADNAKRKELWAKEERVAAREKMHKQETRWTAPATVLGGIGIIGFILYGVVKMNIDDMGGTDYVCFFIIPLLIGVIMLLGGVVNFFDRRQWDEEKTKKMWSEHKRKRDEADSDKPEH